MEPAFEYCQGLKTIDGICLMRFGVIDRTEQDHVFDGAVVNRGRSNATPYQAMGQYFVDSQVPH